MNCSRPTSKQTTNKMISAY